MSHRVDESITFEEDLEHNVEIVARRLQEVQGSMEFNLHPMEDIAQPHICEGEPQPTKNVYEIKSLP